KIPILDKEILRAIPPDQFVAQFCIAPTGGIAEYWRSGGTTGTPLFYPRSFQDMPYAMTAFARTYQCMGCRPGDIAHLSFSLGIHPAGHMWARAAAQVGIGVAWVGAGNAAPSLLQLQLVDRLKPTVWMGMSSYGLHLANLAEAQRIDLAASSVRKTLCTAEPLSKAKRDKLARAWGAEIYDAFGMTDCTMMGAEGEARDGVHIWTDIAFIEVVDEETGMPVGEGEVGSLVVTPLWTNHVTPFLRWGSGDSVTYREHGASSGPFSVFPVVKHAHRTVGFFKVRGVNLSHSEFEDFMFGLPEVNDFKAELVNAGGNDALVLSIEVKRGADVATIARMVVAATKGKFEVTPEVTVLATGTLAREFESAVKAPRFADKSG
ncbi:MAG: phenylacetate--CoA ligase family protein, partial [Alphaproteobacteria bacterium]|nr:phenylacetate--CoA ligase family protein [Alphaproteobacteria bacterium]